MDVDLRLDAAENAGLIFPDTKKNCKIWLNSLPDIAANSISEIIENEKWDELNDRFFKNLEFGTGGMRSRTIAEFVTSYERGNGSQFGAPEHAAIGSAYLNDFNIARATIALFNYCKSQEKNALRLVIAHDVRHFSEHFAKITANIWNNLGGKAILFDGPRSTPQLSFSVRKYNAIAGIVITASHNPYHDNGYKVYFRDGGQVVDPHAHQIINNFNNTSLKEATNAVTAVKNNITNIQYFDIEADKYYIEEVKSCILNKNIFESQKISLVFTPIHGTGDIILSKLFNEFGIKSHFVDEQMVHDPRFPTVKSPNPENFEAFELAIKKSQSVNSELIIGTDPDADRVAIVTVDKNKNYVQLSGNLTGALLEEFRFTKMKQYGLIPQSGGENIAFIKTFVTTPLQEKIAKYHGIKCINTLTGFKWIGEKLHDYEIILQENLKKHNIPQLDYVNTSKDERRNLLMKYSTFFAFGGEESYGYLSSDNVRDKDATAATLMICEMFADLKSQGISLIDFRNEIFKKYGYHEESQLNLYFEGASGAQKIKNILNSYKNSPPTHLCNNKITKIIDFEKDKIYDKDGKIIPPQSFFILELDNGYSYAIRASGTEPKIKFYIFGSMEIHNSIEDTAKEVNHNIVNMKSFIEADALERAKESIS